MKTLIALFGLVVFVHTSALPQNCTECKSRTLHIYDLDTLDMPIPVADHDSIVNFTNAIGIAGRLASYLIFRDPLKDCVIADSKSIGYSIDADIALDYPSDLRTVMGMQDRPPDDGETNDYVILGRLHQMTKYFFVDISLHVGRTKEPVTDMISTKLLFYPNGDPDQVVQAILNEFGPIYARIMEFEKEKRDSGPPYAIFPTVTITPAKKTLDFHEVTSVHIVVTDCDGEPLKGRTVRLTDDAGTLDQTSVTTDDQGTADVLFTAGATPTLAVILGTLSYTTGYGKATECTSDPAAIHIKKPADSWYAEVSYSRSSRDYTTMTADAGPSQWARYETNDDIKYAAWLKATVVKLTRLDSTVLTTRFAFQETSFSEFKFRANETRSDRSRDLFFGSNGGYDNNYTLHTSASATNTPVPKIDLHIGWDTYSFSISGIKAQQSGEGQTVYSSWGPGGTENTVTPETIPPTTNLLASVQGPNGDSSYAIVETDPFGSTTTNVTQTFYWNGKDTCKLWHTQHVYSHSQIAVTGLVNTDEQSTDLIVKVKLIYNDGTSGVDHHETPTIPSSFALEQNYPNPFNPRTTIDFTVAGAKNGSGSTSIDNQLGSGVSGLGSRWVRLAVYDLLGREVAVLVDEKKDPGTYTVMWNANGMASGVYYYRLHSGEFIQTKTMILLR